MTLKDTALTFLWRKNEYDSDIQDTVSLIFINEVYCKTMSDPERAALGYVATFIGSNCNWDGEANPDYSNLKCMILDALNLGYQCSDKHKSFLRKWFRNDKSSLKELETCPVIPYAATSQNTFHEIKLTVNGNKINVWYKAGGINLREQKSWSWKQTDYFLVDKDQIKLLKSEKSNVKYEHIDY